MDVREAVRSSQPLAGRWRLAGRLALIGWIPLLLALSIVVVPSGSAGVRVSQLSGTLAGTLYPGTHVVMPLIHQVELYNVRDQVFSTNPAEIPKDQTPVLKVYSREGLPVGLGISVRYQLDPQRLPYVQSNLPRPVETRSCRQSSPTRFGRRSPATWSAMCSRPSAKKCGASPPSRSRAGSRPTASSSRK